MISNIIAGFYVLLSFIVIGILVYYLTKKNKEKFCGRCTGIGIKTFPNKEFIYNN